MDEMTVENGGMKFVVGENGRNPAKNLPRPSFVHHETHMEGPRREVGTPAVGGERLTACATRPPKYTNIFGEICRISLQSLTVVFVQFSFSFNWLFIIALTPRSYRDCYCFSVLYS